MRVDQRRREIIGDALALLLGRRAEQPQQQEERHHRGHEIGIGDLPRAAVMAAMPLDIDLLEMILGGWLVPCGARAAISVPLLAPQAVEHLGEAGLVLVRDARRARPR